MKRFIFVVLSLAIVAASSSGWAHGWLNGGKGLLHVRPAWSMEPRHLTLYAHSDFFGKVGQVTELRSVAYWDVVGLVNLSYGLNRRFELGITQVVYQDNHKTAPGYNLMDDLFVTVKMGGLGSKTSALSFGLAANGRFPTAKYHNLAFEPYSAGKFSWGFTGMMSYALDPLYPDDDVSLHLNLGYLNYNDVGEELTDWPKRIGNLSVTSPTQEFLYGLGLKLPTREFDYGLEFYGNSFIQTPPASAYARENYLYICPSVVYKPARWASILFALDYRLTADKDETKYGVGYAPIGPFVDEKIPNYPTWRVNVGVKFVLLPTSVYRMTERDILLQKADTRRELFEQIIRERRQTETAEQELERIKEERRKAERELERLRKILEDQAKRREELQRLREELPETKKTEPPPEP
ncbi:MAG: hypothetical protein ONB30_06505 [candidate division KSB1 bacterium]|nr:hypothetical protein [candidate division KSB1 bacterium]